MTDPLQPGPWADAFARRWMELAHGNADIRDVHDWALTLYPPDGLADPVETAEIEYSLLE